MRFLAFLLLITSAFAQEQENPTAIETALLQSTIESQNAVLATTRSEVLAVRNQLDLVKVAKIKPGVTQADGFGMNIDKWYFVPNKKTQEQAVAHYRAKLVEAERKHKDLFETMLPIMDIEQISSGQVGYLGISKTFPYTIKVFQVLNRSEFLGKIKDEIIIVKNVSTEDLTDGKDVSLPFPVEVLGTETYQTKFGSKTVFAVRMLSRDEAIKAMAYVDKHRLKAKPELRDWKAIDGSVIMEAEYVSQEKSNVIVRDAQGEEHKIPIAKLHKDNRLWLKDR